MAFKGYQNHTHMNQYGENRLSMMYATRQVLDQNSSIWNTVPAVATVKGEFDANIASIEGSLALQLKDITGHTEAKYVALKEMVKPTVRVAGGVMAWAEATGDEGLAEEMNIFASELLKYRDSAVAQRCQGVRNAANTNVASLVDYGVTAAEITELQQRIDAYLVLVQQPRNVVIARKGATSEIGLLVRDTQKLLTRRMDMLMRRFVVSAPEFYRQYTNARIIIDRGGNGKVVVKKVVVKKVVEKKAA